MKHLPGCKQPHKVGFLITGLIKKLMVKADSREYTLGTKLPVGNFACCHCSFWTHMIVSPELGFSPAV